MLSCAFIGYQPDEYFFKQNERHPLCLKIKGALLEQAKFLYGRGVRWFYVGGALGADMWASEAVLSLKEQSGYSDIELACIYPFEGHRAKWDDDSTARFEKILLACIDKHPANSADTPVAYKKSIAP